MSETSRTIKLFCPSISKLLPFVALEEQRLDLGSIARTFGLDPATLKLNGHFISRGVDLIASSVTWKSLLSFFSARGLSTGANDANALIVDGKLCKVGTKRAHNPRDGEGGNHQTTECDGLALTKKAQLNDVNQLKKQKMKENNLDICGSSGVEDGLHQTIEYIGLGCKRKTWLEEFNLLKKKKLNETNSDSQGRPPSFVHTISSGQFAYSYFSGNMKRRREDEMIMTGPYKRTR